jgi:hypothetical protein
MAEREVVPGGWNIIDFEGSFEPMASGPHQVEVAMYDDDTITIEHEVPAYPSGYTTERVTVPIRWLTEYIDAVLAYRARKANAAARSET